MKRDISTRTDIEQMIDLFYKKIKDDSLLGPVFFESAGINWEKHISLMCDFWENILFFSGGYKGNPINLHMHLHKVQPLKPIHFQQWNAIFISTVDELFAGKNALLIKQRALNISAIIQKNIFHV